MYFKPPPVGRDFMLSAAFGRLILGPIGSGKTTCCIQELLRRSIEQKPGDDGLRYTRFAIVRQTLRQLLDTVVKDCKDWLVGLGEWKVSDKTFYLEFADVRSEWVFIPLEDSTDQARLLSMQLTGAWLSEAIEMNLDVIAPITGRLGRYPSGRRGAPTWTGIIGDTNFPTSMTPWQEFCEKIVRQEIPGWSVYKQPSGLAYDAENLQHLNQTDETRKLMVNHPDRIARGRMYYTRLVDQWGDDSDWVKRYVKAEYGNDPSGAAVFQNTFKAAIHCVSKAQVLRGYPLIVGQDFGRNPWSIITQPDHLGRIVVLEEVPAENVGLEKHINLNLRPRLLQTKYLGCKVAVVGDPAGVAKDSHSEETSFELLNRCGFPAFPAPTNDIDPRLRAVEAYLGRYAMGGGPALVFDMDGCPKLIRAMAGGYRYKRTKDGGLRAKPDKDDKEGFSHVSDALQYACLVCHGNMIGDIARRLAPPPTSSRGAVPTAGWT